MGNVRMHSPHDVDTHARRGELSTDAKERVIWRTKSRSAVDGNWGSDFPRCFEAAYLLPLHAVELLSIGLRATDNEQHTHVNGSPLMMSTRSSCCNCSVAPGLTTTPSEYPSRQIRIVLFLEFRIRNVGTYSVFVCHRRQPAQMWDTKRFRTTSSGVNPPTTNSPWSWETFL